MKNTVLKYGGWIGIGLSAFLLTSIQFYTDDMHLDVGMIIGYSSMIIAFFFMYFGIRNYKREVGKGELSFGRGLAIGLLITLLASAIYSLAWVVYSETAGTNFMDEYVEMQKKEWAEDGMTAEEIEAELAESAAMMEAYKNPFVKFLITTTEPLPVGVIMSLFLALMLMEKSEEEPDVTAT